MALAMAQWGSATISTDPIVMKKLNLFWLAAGLALLSACEKYDDLIPTPQTEQITADEEELIRLFSELTDNDPSACNLVRDPSEIPDVLCRIVADAEKGSEIVFLVDNTTSMRDDIDEVKRNINRIIDCLPDGVRLGAATYGDINVDGPGWYERSDLNPDYEVARAFINAISLLGGGDDPESVYDALFKTLDEMSWLDCSAPDKIIVMGDAPPLIEPGLTTYQSADVIAKAESICPDTEFYPVIVLDL